MVFGVSDAALRVGAEGAAAGGGGGGAGAGAHAAAGRADPRGRAKGGAG